MDTKFSVAIHIMLFISETDKIASSEIIAKSVNTNSSHIRKITALLKNASLITSSQGKSGFVLAKNSSEITLADIYFAIYEDKKILNIHAEPNIECPLGNNIKKVVQPIFDNAEKQFINSLEQQTLKQLIENLYEIGEK